MHLELLYPIVQSLNLQHCELQLLLNPTQLRVIYIRRFIPYRGRSYPRTRPRAGFARRTELEAVPAWGAAIAKAVVELLMKGGRFTRASGQNAARRYDFTVKA